MAHPRWLEPPRHLLVLFVGIALLLAGTLGWLGVRLLRQDRALEAQQVRERLEAAADAVVADLDRELDGTELTVRRLAAESAELPAIDSAEWAGLLPQGAVLLTLGDSRIQAWPADRLLFTPMPPASGTWSSGALVEAESLEFRTGDFAAAANAYRTAAATGNQRLRTAALLGEARALRKGRQPERALEIYGRLSRNDSVFVDGVPAALLARHARVAILESLGRTDDARAEARSLLEDLVLPRWVLGRGAFEFYRGDLLPRLEAADSTAGESRIALARLVEAVWQDWAASGEVRSSDAGRRLLRSDAGAALVVWAHTPLRRAALIVGTDALAAHWLGEAGAAGRREAVRVALDDPQGTPLVSQLAADASPQVVRTAAESGLPWTIRVASAHPAALAAGFAARRRVMLAGLGVTTLLVLFGTYAVARAVSRELEVARLKSDFVAAVSHEFRTPLTSMRQLTELLATDRVPSDAQRQRYYEVLNREGERLQRLVEGLLDFARMEAGALEFRFEPLDLEHLVRTVVEAFRIESAGRGAVVALRSDGPAAVRGDGDALARALWNLLDNAARYATRDPAIEVTLGRRNGRLALSVQDDGPGIRPEEREQIFRKFVRGSAAEQVAAKGTGIGLAMVRHIVDAHHGEIRLDSRPGEGSRFTILLDAEP